MKLFYYDGLSDGIGDPSFVIESRFTFISDSRYRALLDSDYEEINKCIDAHAYKAAATVAGSLVEALLTDYLIDKQVVSVPVGNTSKTKKTENAGLALLIDYCKNASLISKRSSYLLETIRDFRNLIHPSKAVREDTKVTIDDATVYRAALNIVIDEISKLRQNEFGATAEQLMKFVVSDHNSPALFAHMVKSANSEIERAKFLADITYLELSQRHDELGPYFDEDGVPTFHDIEDAQFAERIEQIISRIYHCCQICFVEANYESQKAAANALLKSLKFGTASEKKYLGNLFDPSMTGLVLEADSDFLADYLIVCSKTLETLVLFRILPRIGQVLPLRYTNRIIDAVFHHVKNRGASDFSQPIAEYLNRMGVATLGRRVSNYLTSK